MVGQPSGRTFISYSRKDGADFARDLRASLEKESLSFWQDLTALEGGQDWWSQIENALRSEELQHFILVVSPKALESGVVKQEIRLARQEGKSVCPVRGPGVADLDRLPRWLGHVYDLDLKEQRTALVGKLQKEAEPRRVPMMAPELPADFVPRPREFGALKARLLDPGGDSIAGITAALRGAGGYGKTTLARALARDPDIQDAYFDGILWAELGEKPERLIATLSDLVTLLSGERPQLETINAAAAKLREVLGDRRILMVIDDVWREQDLQPFLQGGRNCVRLVTTRIDSVLPAAGCSPEGRRNAGGRGAVPDLFRPAAGARDARAGEPCRPRCAYWRMAAVAENRQRLPAQPRQAPTSRCRSPSRGRTSGSRRKALPPSILATRRNAARLRRARSASASTFCRRRNGSVSASWASSRKMPTFRSGSSPRLWAATGGLEDFETDDLLAKLFDLSLLLERDLGQGFLRLHDTVRQFLRDRAGKERLIAQHKALIASLDGAGEAADERTRRYFYP